MQSETTMVKPAPKKRWTKEMFITAFAQGTLRKKGIEGNWAVSNYDGVQTLRYHATGQGYGRSWDYAQQRETEEIKRETLAVKLPDGLILSNANRLKWIGSQMCWGRRSRVWQDTEEQRLLVKLGSMPVPFSVFEAAKLDLTKIKVVEKAPAEQVQIEVDDGYDEKLGRQKRKLEDRHYVGACLLESEGQYFLFDIDRRELANRIFNPFVVKLAKPASSIAEAYEGLIPEAVKQAKGEGVPVERQGEWFFIKRYGELPPLAPIPADLKARVDNPPHVEDFGGKADSPSLHAGNVYEAGDMCWFNFEDEGMRECYEFSVEEWEKDKRAILEYSPREGSLQQGDSRPNRVTRYVKHEGMVLVSGTISHTGREHKDLTLEGWWEALPNTAVSSWQVSGEID